ncbi:unnamed protein product [Allacma fusca]|uniref:Uncharacterized protein n=1 Tax=Allacma fusca TaxID=39272 RepID=A0A8J2K2V9_9HEXA|nr:unnamed protein product [Allacma fusca]
MGKSQEYPYRLGLLSPAVLTAVLCLIVGSASSAKLVSKHDARLSAEPHTPHSRHAMSTPFRADNDMMPSSKVQLRKHKKYDPNELNVKIPGGVTPFSRPNEKSFWESKSPKLIKHSRRPYVNHVLMQLNLHDASPISSPRKSPLQRLQLTKRRNRSNQSGRSRRQVAPNVTQTEDDGADGDDSEFVGHTRPKPTPQPPRNEQYAIQKSETGQTQSQQSGATDTDDMNYNPDGSVKSHNLGTANSNKQETAQFQRSETMIPIAGPLSTDSVLGKSENGTQNNFFTAMSLGSLSALPGMQPFQQAAITHGRRRGSKSKAKTGVGKNGDRLLQADEDDIRR